MSKRKTLAGRIAGWFTGRRFEAAAHDRDSIEQYSRVDYDREINEDLSEDLPTMRARCRDAARNNPLVEGVINTHKTDVVGSDGPVLDVQSDDERYNQEAEDLWREFRCNCDYNGQLAFCDFLRQDIEAAWTSGDSIKQVLYDRRAPSPIKLRLLGITSDRLDTPYDQFGNPNVVMGVELSESGRPVYYYIAEPTHIGPYRYQTGKYNRLRAEDVLHVYEAIEAGQVRGIPWLASSLRGISHSDAFDRETIEAARTAAIFGAVATVKDGMIDPGEFKTTTGKIAIPTRSIAYMAPGYDIKQLAAQHPNAHYVEFQHEQFRKLGRPVGMPLMTILLDARYHNYSSARYDGQVYRRHLNVIQSRLTRQVCNPIANQVLLDGERFGLIRRRPESVRTVWGWSQPPEIDEHKAAIADQLELRTGSISLSQVCARRNRSFEEVVAARLRDDELLAANGLPSVRDSVAVNPSAAQAAAESNESGDNQNSRFHVGMTL